MTVAVPSAVELKTKLPFFASVDDGVMADFITEAGRSVDDTWIAGDQKNAIMYLAAHNMFILGVTGSGGAPPGGAGGSGVVQSQSIGDASVSYAVNSFLKKDGGLNEELRSTVWGRMYLRLARLNGPAVDIV